MSLTFPFDPMQRSQATESVVMRGDQRLYYRFRSSPHHGGVVTADTTGCDLLCCFCWNYDKNLNPVRGRFHSPAEVVAKLLAESAQSGFKRFRVSGAEPILGRRSATHLAQVLAGLPPGKAVVETNGIMLGRSPQLLDLLLPHRPYFFFAVKGDSPVRFEELTGANAAAFRYQLRAVKEFQKRGAAYNVVALSPFLDSTRLDRLFPGEEIVWEPYRNFGNTNRNLKRRGVKLDGNR